MAVSSKLSDNGQSGMKDSRPVPDPTLLTTQQLTREIAALREILEAQIRGQSSIFEARLGGMDKAIELVQVASDRQSGSTSEKIDGLRKLHEEKFHSIGLQFVERDVRTETMARDSKVAVDAALQAAKEAVGEQNKSSALAIAKSEMATTKSIDQQGLLINTTTASLNDKIEDVKQRCTKLESEDKGKQTAVTTQQTSNQGMVAVIALIVAFVMGAGGLIVALIK